MSVINVVHIFAILVWGVSGYTAWAYVQHTVNTMRGYCYSAFGPERIHYHGDKQRLKDLRSWAALWLLASLMMLAVVLYGPQVPA